VFSQPLGTELERWTEKSEPALLRQLIVTYD